jgi:hypothetical protein
MEELALERRFLSEIALAGRLELRDVRRHLDARRPARIFSSAISDNEAVNSGGQFRNPQKFSKECATLGTSECFRWANVDEEGT